MKAKIGFLVLSFSLYLGILGALAGFTWGVGLLSFLAFLLIQFSFYAWSFYNFYMPWRWQDFIVPFFLTGLALGMAGLFLLQMGYTSLFPATGVAFTYFFVDVLFRWTFKKILSLLPKKKVIFLGESSLAIELASRIAKNETEWEFLAFFTRDSRRLLPTPRQIVWKDWSEVYTLLPSLQPDLFVWEDPLELEGASYLALPEEIMDLAPTTRLIDFTVLTDQKILVSQARKAWIDIFLKPVSRRSVWLKRMVDLSMAVLLLPLLLPLMLITALLTKVTSPGKVLYSQEREGFKGKLFTIYKFRSMTSNAESKGAQWAKVNDSRVTSWGRIMRKLRLDELPQIWNVLKGDMSFVGPRPERPEFTHVLAQQIPFYRERNRVKPGLTGWAQINYPYGASVEDALHKTEYDLYYVHNPSLWMDFKILLKTVQTVLMGKGQ